MAMTILWTYGYTDVGSLKGGFGGWAEAGYPVMGGTSSSVDLDSAFNTFLSSMEAYQTISLDALNTMIVENPPFILDVRSVAEVEENGYIEGAVVIPLPELTANLDKLPSFDTPIVSYCGSGWRCTIALTILEGMGWEDVKGLKGGSFSGWVEAGYPVAEGLPEAEVLDAVTVDPALVDTMTAAIAAIPEGWGGITADNFNLALGENPDLQVIDVRTDGELAEKGIIEAPNWTHIPLEEFVNMKDQWPADMDANIVVYCGSGHRSTIAMTILYAYGYTDVSSLKGGFGGWVEAGYPIIEFAAE
jgi:rhodanese-related sulfurtransferase